MLGPAPSITTKKWTAGTWALITRQSARQGHAVPSLSRWTQKRREGRREISSQTSLSWISSLNPFPACGQPSLRGPSDGHAA